MRFDRERPNTGFMVVLTVVPLDMPAPDFMDFLDIVERMME